MKENNLSWSGLQREKNSFLTGIRLSGIMEKLHFVSTDPQNGYVERLKEEGFQVKEGSAGMSTAFALLGKMVAVLSLTGMRNMMEFRAIVRQRIRCRGQEMDSAHW